MSPRCRDVGWYVAGILCGVARCRRKPAAGEDIAGEGRYRGHRKAPGDPAAPKRAIGSLKATLLLDESFHRKKCLVTKKYGRTSESRTSRPSASLPSSLLSPKLPEITAAGAPKQHQAARHPSCARGTAGSSALCVRQFLPRRVTTACTMTHVPASPRSASLWRALCGRRR
jgi:hypothetical protein